MLHAFRHVTSDPNCYPSVMPNWDDSARRGKRAFILHQLDSCAVPSAHAQGLGSCGDKAVEDRIIFVKSWNEWAEGNYLEPDLRFGHQYLDVVREEVFIQPSRERNRSLMAETAGR